jgi:Leu/Phe-tRNA-protein transferase
VEAGGTFVDVQIVTPHLESLGAVERRRDQYLDNLSNVRDDDVRLRLDPRPVSRLAERFHRVRRTDQ